MRFLAKPWPNTMQIWKNINKIEIVIASERSEHGNLK